MFVGAAVGAGAPKVDCPNPPVLVGAGAALLLAPPNWNTPLEAAPGAVVLLLLPKLKTPA